MYAAEKKYLPEEKAMLQEEGEEIEEKVHPETHHKVTSGHRKKNIVYRGISTEQD